MPANRPEECDLLLAKAVNAGDLEAVVAFYEPVARFVAGPDSIATGTDAIRAVMTQMLSGKPRLSIEVPTVVECDGIALLFSKWSSTTTGADGKETTESGNGREVVRRQADGTWRFIIDHPSGGD